MSKEAINREKAQVKAKRRLERKIKRDSLVIEAHVSKKEWERIQRRIFNNLISLERIKGTRAD